MSGLLVFSDLCLLRYATVPRERVLVIDDSPTILRVVQLALSKADYEVITAPDGEQGIAMARAAPPDVILLDFVMPRMNGYQVCRTLAENSDLRDVPVILMSAKGDQVGERFVRVLGIVDYITKPFSPEALLAVVGHTVAKYRDGMGRPGGETAVIAVPAAPPSALPPEERRRQQVGHLRETLLRALAEAHAHDAEGAEIVRQLEVRLSESLVRRVLDAVLPEADGDTANAVLEGDLAAVPLAEVLALLDQQVQTGILTIKRDGARVLVCFRRGKVDFAGAEGLGEEYGLGRYLVEVGAIPREELEALAAAPQANGPLPAVRGTGHDDRRFFGERLGRLRPIAASDIREALRRQTCERIYETLRWRSGRFAFMTTSDLGPLAEKAQLDLAVGGILLEGFRRVDEWHLIERAIEDFDAVFLPSETAPGDLERARLTREELMVLELVDGHHSVRDIQRQSRMSSFEVSKMLYRLLSIRLIRRRVSPVAV
jgi:DNA-binding response OmpR family regulator